VEKQSNEQGIGGGGQAESSKQLNRVSRN